MALKVCLDTVCMPLFHGTDHMLHFLSQVPQHRGDPSFEECVSLTPGPFLASVMVQRTDYCSKVPCQPARGLYRCCKYLTCTILRLGNSAGFARGCDDQARHDQYGL